MGARATYQNFRQGHPPKYKPQFTYRRIPTNQLYTLNHYSHSLGARSFYSTYRARPRKLSPCQPGEAHWAPPPYSLRNSPFWAAHKLFYLKESIWQDESSFETASRDISLLPYILMYGVNLSETYDLGGHLNDVFYNLFRLRQPPTGLPTRGAALCSIWLNHVFSYVVSRQLVAFTCPNLIGTYDALCYFLFCEGPLGPRARAPDNMPLIKLGYYLFMHGLHSSPDLSQICFKTASFWGGAGRFVSSEFWPGYEWYLYALGGVLRGSGVYLNEPLEVTWRLKLVVCLSRQLEQRYALEVMRNGLFVVRGNGDRACL